VTLHGRRRLRATVAAVLVAGAVGVVRALREAGMVVDNHSWSHPRMTKLSLARQRAQVRRMQDLLEATIGQRPRFFRPPLFTWSRTTARAVAEQGMVGVLFSIDPRDWSRPGVTAIVQRSLKAHKGRSSPCTTRAATARKRCRRCR
jgi:peptidoglycan/xylan/chitin deacetylase (PgdA/CDA1 family)